MCARVVWLTEDKARKEVILNSGVSSLVAVRGEHTFGR